MPETVLTKDNRGAPYMRTEIVLISFLGAGPVFADSCLDLLNNDSPYADLVACVKSDLIKQVAAELAGTHVDELRGMKGEPGTDTQVPSGAVLAFDRPDGCPEGWRADISVAAGRMIVGVDGSKYRLPYEGGTPSYITGGEEAHVLTLEEMPSHRHTITSSPPPTDIHDGFGGSSQNSGLREVYDPTELPIPGWSRTQHDKFMSPEGGDQAHNNMPPYIALYYCKKE